MDAKIPTECFLRICDKDKVLFEKSKPVQLSYVLHHTFAKIHFNMIFVVPVLLLKSPRIPIIYIIKSCKELVPYFLFWGGGCLRLRHIKKGHNNPHIFIKNAYIYGNSKSTPKWFSISDCFGPCKCVTYTYIAVKTLCSDSLLLLL